MKTTVKQIKVSSCYRIDRQSENMDASTALRVMSSDRSGLYDSASKREDFSVTLTSCNLICPYCNHSYLLKSHNKIAHKHMDTMEQWADPQLTLLDQRPQKIIFFPVDIATFLCPNCGYSSNNQENVTAITISCRKNKVSIRCEVTDLFRILSLQHLPKSMFRIEFPLYEQIEFHLQKGRTCIRIVNGNGQALRTVDVTNSPHELSKCVLLDWFYKVEEIRKAIIKAFQTASQAKIPFKPQNVTFEDFLFFTRFVGYDKDFYHAIPYEKETLIVDSSFKHLQKLHTQKSAITYLLSFSFAKFKSIRKLVYEKSELLFYLPECEKLFQAVGDVNVLRTILRCDYALDILLTLHQYPVFIDFFRDYCNAKGAANLYDRICSGSSPWYDLRYYMFYYCALNQYGRLAEQKKWKHKNNYIDDIQTHSYSLPITKKTPKEETCVVNSFVFKPLRNTAECFRVGKELKNCLGTWESFNSAIVTVSNDGETVAAIAVWGNSISQAYAYDNNSVESVPGLSDAINEWATQSGLCFAPTTFIDCD